MSTSLPLLDSLSALADPTRCRILRLLDQQELTVSELCAVLQLPQSTVSRQLKILGDAEWVASRRDGTSRYYSAAIDHADEARARIWELTRSQLAGRAGTDQDERRLASVLATRSETSREFFASGAGQWDRLREDLFGRDFAAAALLAWLPSKWTVADLGCGTGAMLPLVAPHVRQVIGVDASEEMLGAARARTADLSNVDLRRGSLESLPVEEASVNAAMMMLVLHHLPSPAAALREAGRILVPNGRLLVVDMTPHDHEEYRQEMGHIWLGFTPGQMQKWLAEAGFVDVSVHALPASASVKGPGLFAAAARRAMVP